VKTDIGLLYLTNKARIKSNIKERGELRMSLLNTSDNMNFGALSKLANLL
jgi:hypothetical protein